MMMCTALRASKIGLPAVKDDDMTKPDSRPFIGVD
jgi:hypothetical protein